MCDWSICALAYVCPQGKVSPGGGCEQRADQVVPLLRLAAVPPPSGLSHRKHLVIIDSRVWEPWFLRLMESLILARVAIERQ